MARTNEIQAEINALKQMLGQTDHSVNKFTEGLFNVFKESTALNLLSNLVTYMAKASTSYAGVITDRQTWRARINELEAMLEDGT